MQKIIKVEHQGFCYGVKHSIKMVLDVLNDKKYPRPIYLLNSIVHNQDVNNYFKEKGVIILEGKTKLELLDEINTGTVIFSAHGVGDVVKEKASKMNITVVDATCPFVEKSYQLIKKYLNNDYHLLYIGKAKHPETEAVLSFSNHISLITDENNIKIPNSNYIAIAHQTTMSDYDVKSIYDKVKTINEKVIVLPMICNATKLRQDDLKHILETTNLNNALVIIVGDKTSNNCTKLSELALMYTKSVKFISNYLELTDFDVSIFDTIIIASGTSTPIVNVDNIILYLSKKKVKSNSHIEKYV